ncbi:hypothetical protein A5767_01525 [Rhodococcus sp. 852002-51564_SCH6189132-a]|nr:hypothetical protein A5767_01525 [Rhodococcus sp. 852002-51564_SCH6189132-a]
MSNDAERTDFVAPVKGIAGTRSDGPDSRTTRGRLASGAPYRHRSPHPRIGTELVPVEGIDENDIEHPAIDDLPIEQRDDHGNDELPRPEFVVDATDPDSR